MYSVQYTQRAAKSIKKLPRDVQIRILDSIDDLAKDPAAHMKRLKGERDVPIFSHRMGEYRVLFTLSNAQLVILVLNVGNRRDIYKEL
ncbi:MAG: type II toxin-antitoxin system RelE/ParE family toxin [Methanocorpusculum sp.]|uniref:type II toxin-antitoxin system RelE family toxin n=1 Tax=Methanocorpusculum sp. TaxID=2058474 RepID=UPI0027244D39|nr:type II toxin-antitoxin system RelE/ParE family toxin [Methanocorpusculum sp.]